MVPEVEQYLTRIEDLRRQVGELIAGLPAEALNWRPVEGGGDHNTNSLAVLAAHVAGAEHFWIAEVIGEEVATRRREAEFKIQAQDVAELQARLHAVGEETRRILSSLDEKDLSQGRLLHERIVPVRWAILHVIDHTALHLGHMQLTLQLWQGGKSKGGPRWFQRLG